MTNQQITIRTLDLIRDVAEDARQPLKEQRNNIRAYALELAVKGNTPVQIFQILKAQADALDTYDNNLFYVSADAWLNAAKLDLELMQSA